MCTPRLIPVILVATLVYLALPILGWGGVAAFFANPARIALALVMLALTGAALFSAGNLSPGLREDRSNRWVLGAFGAIGVLLGWLPAYMDRIDVWTLDGDALRWVGVALFAAGGTLRLRAVFVLGDRFSGLVAIQPGHRLVTTGIYGVVRHPSYLGLIVSTLGWVLAFRSLAGVLLVLALMVPLMARIRAEEALLKDEFGREYEAYCARTARLVPGLY